MKTVANVVEEIIKRKPFLESALSQGIINMTSLANDITEEVQRELKKDVKVGAIVMAIKRLAPTLEFQINHKVRNVLINLGDITVRSKLADYTYKVSESLIKNQIVFLNEVSEHPDLYYAVSRGVYETTFVVSEKFEENLNRIFKNEFLVSKKSGLSSLTIKLPEENSKVAGIYYYIFRDLAWEGINIYEVISTTNEFTIIVDDDQVEKAFKLLKKLSNNK
jgi:aspartokinase